MRHGRDDYNARIQDSAGIIPVDEPVFLLRAQDVTAPDTVRAWANLQYRSDKDGARETANAAMEHADMMERWQREHGSKRADAPLGGETVPTERSPSVEAE